METTLVLREFDYHISPGLRDPDDLNISLAEFNNNNNQDLEVLNQNANNSSVLAPELVTDTETVSEFFSKDDEQPRMAENAVLLTTHTWSPTSLRGTTTVITDRLLNRLVNSSNVGVRIKPFSYLQGEITVTANVQGFAPAYGRLVMFAYPTAGGETGYYSYSTLENVRILPHVIIDPSKTASYSLTVPLYHPRGVITPRDTLSWGVALMVYDELNSGTDTNNDITVIIRASLNKASFVGKTIPLGLIEEEGDWKPSDYVKRSTKVLRAIMPVVPSYSGILTLVSKAGDVVGDVLSYLGYSKPSYTDLSFLKIIPGDNYKHVDGPSRATVVGRSQVMCNAIDPHLMQGSFEDQNFSHLLSKPILIESFVLEQSMTPGFLFEVPVIPHIPGKISTSYLPGLLARFHSQWSGTMKYHIEIPASVFNRATILVAYQPGPGAPPSLSDAITYLDTVTIVVSGNTSVSLEVPWRQPSVTLPQNLHNGYLRFYLMDPLLANGSATGVNIDVIGDWSGINFHTPHDPVGYLTPSVVTPMGDWIEVTPYSFGKQSVDHTILQGGDTTRTLKDLVSRMNRINVADATSVYMTYTGSTNYGPLVNTDGAKRDTFCGIFSPMFLGYRGSLRVSAGGTSRAYISCTDEQVNTPAPASVTAGTSSTPVYAVSYGLAVENTQVVSSGDFIIPYISSGAFSPGYLPVNTNSVLRFRVVDEPLEASDPNIPPRRWFAVAAGDDAVFGFFLGVPVYN